MITVNTIGPEALSHSRVTLYVFFKLLLKRPINQINVYYDPVAKTIKEIYSVVVNSIG